MPTAVVTCGSLPALGASNLGHRNPPFNDRISSVWNRGGDQVRLYNWTGSWTWVANVEVGQSISFYWPFDSRNDIVDEVIIGDFGFC